VLVFIPAITALDEVGSPTIFESLLEDIRVLSGSPSEAVGPWVDSLF